MTLLDASVHLVDTAKQMPENRILNQAIKRMEKRIQVLRLRSAKARRRNRRYAWQLFVDIYGHNRKLENKPPTSCQNCDFAFDFGSFVKHADITGRGQIQSLHCPRCDAHLMGYE